MNNKGGPRLLVTDKEGALLLERSRVHVEGARIVYYIEDDEFRREFNIPHVNLAVLFLGQGTSITQEALRLLGEEGVHVAITGTGGTPLHYGSLTNYAKTEYFRRLLPIYLDDVKSLPAAISIMKDRTERLRTIGRKYTEKLLQARDVSPLLQSCSRFSEKLDEASKISEILGYEGNFTKSVYRSFAEISRMKDDFIRVHGQDKDSSIILEPNIKRINSLIDHGNYLCYGMAGAALWALGIPPSMSVIHGKTREGGLVFDVADSFKDAFVLPLAFHFGKSKSSDYEKAFRASIIDAFNDKDVLAEAISTIKKMIEKSETGEL